MIEGRTIICFASGYNAPPTSKHHVMHLLAERNKVLWINYHASRMPTAAASDVRRVFRKLAQVRRGLQNPRPNLHVLTPLVLPLPGSRWAQRLNRRLLKSQIHRALRQLDSAGPPAPAAAATDNPERSPRQVWSFSPDVSYLLGEFDEEKVIYYCVDDFASFSGYDKHQVLRDEAEICARADLVITTAAELQSAKAPLSRQCLLVRHGVDYEHFSRSVSEALAEPDELADIGHPRLGFFGLLRDWVDLDLLAGVARRRPQWHFVLIGDSTVSLAPYLQLKNMHFLGRKDYGELPRYCRGLDVGLIPFKLNDLTMAVNPIKLQEYLAAGLPVVSTPLPEVVACSRSAECGKSVLVADGVDEFEQAIAQALAEANLPDDQAVAIRRRRSQAMQSETWQAKLDLIARHLQEPDSRQMLIKERTA